MTKTKTGTEIMTLIGLIEALIELIKANPNGVSGGELYALLCDKLDLEKFNRLMELTVMTGKIEQDMPHHYRAC